MNDMANELSIISSLGCSELDVTPKKQIILAGMQPYFFPYIGYFQLLECSDVFVIGDDFQYMKGGWINRNRVLIEHGPSWLTFPVQSGSVGFLINQRYYVDDQKARNMILRNIELAYRKAPYFKDIYPIIVGIMSFGSNNVSEFNTNAIRRLSELLEINCHIMLSSELMKDPLMKGQERIIEINRCLGSRHFVNPIGGISLYQENHFMDCGIELSFLQTEYVQYHQFAEPFTPSLSIIDVLMFCSLDEIKILLKKFQLIKQVQVN